MFGDAGERAEQAISEAAWDGLAHDAQRFTQRRRDTFANAELPRLMEVGRRSGS